MRSISTWLPVLTILALSITAASAQQLPHGWLFGTWTGGLFPVEPSALAEACQTPTVIFSKDTVARAAIIDPDLTERVIETVRANPNGAEFRFTSAIPSESATAEKLDAGFGCENPDVLHVARTGENEISFPHCAAFPNPLLRCPAAVSRPKR
jgi:hypothetical protein